jgi:hypothetical protein
MSITILRSQQCYAQQDALIHNKNPQLSEMIKEERSLGHESQMGAYNQDRLNFDFDFDQCRGV